MAIQKMKRLRLVAVRSRKEELLRELLRRGCVEISEPGEEAAALRCESSEAMTWRGKNTSLVQAVTVLDKVRPEKSSLLAPTPEVESGKLLSSDGMAEALALAEEILALDDRIRRISAEESRLRGEEEALRPWLPLDLPLGREGTGRCSILLGCCGIKTESAVLAAALAEGSDEAELIEVSADARTRYYLVVCMKETLPAVQEKLRSCGFTALSFAGEEGTAQEALARTGAALEALAAEKADCADRLASLAPRRGELKLAADKTAARIAMAEAEEKLLATERTVVLTGWMPAEREEELAEVFESFDCAWESEDPAEEDYPQVPVSLKNNKVTNSLNMVTNMYSLPQYGTVDPNPLMAPFFILFYGLMMADIGYGLMMIAAAVVALRKLKPREGTLSFCQLLLYCGIATLAMGCLTGGLFSDAPVQIARMIDPNTGFRGLPYLFSPTAPDRYTIFGMELDSSSLVLYGSMVLGLLHMNTGMVVSFLQKWKAGSKADAIWEEGSQWLLLVGILLAVAGIGNVGGVPVVLILSVAALLFGAGRHEKGFGKVTAAFSCIYNTATGWFGDILSYARIMALMLAGGVIGQVFNTVAAMPARNSGLTVFTGAAFLVIFLFGHLMNFALNLLGCYVHDLRLQCLEYFNKFYVAGGKPFRPLRFVGKYFFSKETEI